MENYPFCLLQNPAKSIIVLSSGVLSMKNSNLGFIGIGNMASAIIGGILSTNFIKPENIYMYNPHPEKMQHFVEAGCIPCTSLDELAETCSTIFLCIKPQAFPDVLLKLQPLVANKKANDVLFVSIAAGITFQNLQSALGADRLYVRAMPNTPLLLGKGATSLSRTSNVSSDDFKRIYDIFSCCGLVREVPEEQINAVIAVSGSSPAYLYLLAKLACDYAEQRGMDRKTALALFCQTMTGSAEMLLNSGKDPQTLIDMVTSKGGTTFALLGVLREHGFDETMLASFAACEQRAKELSM